MVGCGIGESERATVSEWEQQQRGKFGEPKLRVTANRPGGEEDPADERHSALLMPHSQGELFQVVNVEIAGLLRHAEGVSDEICRSSR